VRANLFLRFAKGVLSLITDEVICSSVIEDMEHRFSQDLKQKGRIRAEFGRIFQFVIIVVPLLMEAAFGGMSMFKNYIKTAFRNIKEHLGYSFINIFGLAVGMTVCLLMLMYVVNETSYDNFHEKDGRIYRLACDWGTEGSKMKFAGTMPAFAPALNSEIPEIEVAARIRHNSEMIILGAQNEKFKQSQIFHADPEVFDIFSWKLLEGDSSSVLAEPFSVVITQKIAKKYFNTDDPIGKTLNIDGNLYKVTGLLRDFPPNTHLDCEILISYATVHSLGKYAEQPWTQWGDDLTYFVLRENSSLGSVAEKVNALLTQNTGEWFTKKMDLVLQPLSKIHWETEYRGDIGAKGNILYVYLFLSAAILVLAIACFNFMNLSTSRYLDRMKEIGVRKVVGANRNQLIRQFLTESLLVTTVSMVFGVILFNVLYSSLYSYLDAPFGFSVSHFQNLYALVVLLVLVVGLLAGSYPAWFMSRFHPADIMNKRAVKNTSRVSFRNVLVVLQFAISIILAVGTIIIYQQIDFMKNSDLGFDKEDVVLAYFPFTNPEAKEKYPVLKTEFSKHQNVVEVTGVYTVPGINSQYNMTVRKMGGQEGESISIQALPADFGLVESLGLEIVSGRDFSEEYSLDSKESAILNEAAVKMFGFEKPVGEKLQLFGEREVSIIGVVKDFHVKSLHSKISPMLIYIDPKFYLLTATKIKPENSEETLAYLEDVWKTVLGESEFNYRYMKDAYYSFYSAEEKTGRLISIFTMLALFISCLGLFGLAAFMTNRKVKEIGIRKVLGASVRSIATLYSKEFTKWVIFSNIIAWPVAYFLIDRWLGNFAYRIGLTPMPFILSGAAALLIALVTVSSHAIRAAMANPVDSLRSE
jgi:putative ABC transport system permease protein